MGKQRNYTGIFRLHTDHIGKEMQADMGKWQDIFVSQQQPVGNLLGFYNNPGHLLDNFETIKNIQGIEKSQYRQQEGKIKKQIGNISSPEADQDCGTDEEEQINELAPSVFQAFSLLFPSLHKTGTFAARMASCSTSFSFFPSRRACADRISRWRSTGWARAATSSGVVKLRPSR